LRDYAPVVHKAAVLSAGVAVIALSRGKFRWAVRNQTWMDRINRINSEEKILFILFIDVPSPR
jgi:hypothetical protein